MKIIEKVAWLRIENRRVLFLRSKGRDKFYFPGGKREKNESDMETLTRELKEELGVEFKPETAVRFEAFRAHADAQAEPTIVESIFYMGDVEGRLVPSSEIEELAWLSSKDGNKLTVLGTAVVQRLKEKDLVD